MGGNPEARARIRQHLDQAQRKVVVLDDDPVGPQTTHGLDVLTTPTPAALSRALSAAAPAFCVLTNTRAMPQPEAEAVSETIAADVLTIAARQGVEIDIVNRGDSTLRGHFLAEGYALDRARRAVLGRGFDGYVFAPQYFEAGRVTVDDVQHARHDGELVPVSETVFAKDTAFGFRNANLRHYLAEKSSGAISADDVLSVSRDDIRNGGPDRVARLLASLADGRMAIVNAEDYRDLEIVVLGAQSARAQGSALLFRGAPSFVRVVTGTEPRPPLRHTDVYAHGPRPGHGLIVVGSHVPLSTRQYEAARKLDGITCVEARVSALLDPAQRDAHLTQVAAAVRAGLRHSDVLLHTSREPVAADGADANLATATAISGGVAAIVRALRPERPRFIISKGGLTTSDLLTKGLGVRRAAVLGQLLPGLISVWLLVDSDAQDPTLPYVVFPGNVGDTDTLASIIEELRGSP